MNYCKSIKVVSDDGKNWRIEYQQKTKTTVYDKVENFEHALSLANAFLAGVDVWLGGDYAVIVEDRSKMEKV